jgi:hypothetical protein
MKRYACPVVAVLFMSAATAQPLLPRPLPVLPEPCRLMCVCSGPPGQVDECVDQYAPPKSLEDFRRRVLNNDPGACGSSIEKNRTALAGYYAKSPEISLPTKEMAALVAALPIPAAAPLPALPLQEASLKDDTARELRQRIEVATQRIGILTTQVQAFSQVAKTTGAWRLAALAGERLARRTEGAANSLSLARSWPTIAEFGPMIWKTGVCERLATTTIAALGRRLQDDTDIAWQFAFYDDLVALFTPFGASLIASATPDESAFAALARPFFAESSERARQRSDKTLVTFVELQAFGDAVRKTSVPLSGYVNGLLEQTASRRRELESRHAGETAIVDGLKTALTGEQRTVALLKEAAESAHATLARLVNDIGALRTRIDKAASALAAANAERDRLRAVEAGMRAEADAQRAAVDAASRHLASILLACNGAIYKECKDERAKREFDRQTYIANQAYASATLAYNKGADARATAMDALSRAETGLRTARALLARQRDALGLLVQSREQADVDFSKARAEHALKEAELLATMGAMEALDGAALALATLLSELENAPIQASHPA